MPFGAEGWVRTAGLGERTCGSQGRLPILYFVIPSGSCRIGSSTLWTHSATPGGPNVMESTSLLPSKRSTGSI